MSSLTPSPRVIYDRATLVWDVMKEIWEAHGKDMGTFWGCHQKFFCMLLIVGVMSLQAAARLTAELRAVGVCTGRRILRAITVAASRQPPGKRTPSTQAVLAAGCQGARLRAGGQASAARRDGCGPGPAKHRCGWQQQCC